MQFETLVRDIHEVHLKEKLSLENTRSLLHDVFGSIVEATRGGDRIQIPSFGGFFIQTYKARRMKAPPNSPQAGSLITLPERKTLRFRPSKNVKA